MSSPIETAVRSMIDLAIPRDLIVRSIERQFNHQLLPKDVSNVKSRMQRETLSNQSVIRALFESCHDDGVKTSFKNDDKGQLTHLALKSPLSTDIWRKHPDVMLLDCTYKTNKYGLPALNIVGVTNQNTSFQIAFILIKKETEIDFNWAM